MDGFQVAGLAVGTFWVLFGLNIAVGRSCWVDRLGNVLRRASLRNRVSPKVVRIYLAAVAGVATVGGIVIVVIFAIDPPGEDPVTKRSNSVSSGLILLIVVWFLIVAVVAMRTFFGLTSRPLDEVDREHQL